MIQPADVTKLKCVYFKLTWDLFQKQAYSIDCDVATITSELDTVKKYLFIINISSLICRSLECKILEILDKYSFTYCARDTTQYNIR